MKIQALFWLGHCGYCSENHGQSTQWGVSLSNTFPIKNPSKSMNPALNIPRRHEAVATDTVFSDTPAVDSGVKQAQVFVSRIL